MGEFFSLSRPGGGWVMCCICFEYRQPEGLYVDITGQMWDVCRTGTCAEQSGIPARTKPTFIGCDRYLPGHRHCVHGHAAECPDMDNCEMLEEGP